MLLDSHDKMMLRTETLEKVSGYPWEMPDSPLYERLRESLGIFMTTDVMSEVVLGSLQDFLAQRDAYGLMVVPLATGTTLHGLFMIFVDQPYRFEVGEIELARTISNQASVALQNARLFAETERLVAETENRSTELAALFELA